MEKKWCTTAFMIVFLTNVEIVGDNETFELSGRQTRSAIFLCYPDDLYDPQRVPSMNGRDNIHNSKVTKY